MSAAALLAVTDAGLYCPPGDFHIDPWQPVPRAVLTHGHADHARRGSGRYLAAPEGLPVLRTRLGDEARIDALPYGAAVVENGVRLSLHPAGHILGSAQVRVEHRGEVWVVSGDYKTRPDPTCAPFEPVRCHTFVTESTFGLPIYRWPDDSRVFAEVNAWWRANRDEGRPSLLYAYALGKAQRLLAGVDAAIGPLFAHGAVEAVNRAYAAAGVKLPEVRPVGGAEDRADWQRGLVVAPPSAQRSPWVRKFGEHGSAFASGWMLVRGARRRRAVDRGFALSDHADWPGLLDAIAATGATRVLVTHGHTGAMVRWLRERGLDADVLATRFEGEADEVGGEDPPGEGTP